MRNRLSAALPRGAQRRLPSRLALQDIRMLLHLRQCLLDLLAEPGVLIRLTMRVQEDMAFVGQPAASESGSSIVFTRGCIGTDWITAFLVWLSRIASCCISTPLTPHGIGTAPFGPAGRGTRAA